MTDLTDAQKQVLYRAALRGLKGSEQIEAGPEREAVLAWLENMAKGIFERKFREVAG